MCWTGTEINLYLSPENEKCKTACIIKIMKKKKSMKELLKNIFKKLVMTGNFTLTVSANNKVFLNG